MVVVLPPGIGVLLFEHLSALRLRAPRQAGIR